MSLRDITEKLWTFPLFFFEENICQEKNTSALVAVYDDNLIWKIFIVSWEMLSS